MIEIGPNLQSVMFEQLRIMDSLTSDKDRYDALHDFAEMVKYLLEKAYNEAVPKGD